MSVEGVHDDLSTKQSTLGPHNVSRDLESGHTRLSPPKRPWQRVVTPAAEITEGPYEGEGTTENPYICQWLDEDPEDPQQFSKAYKMTIMLMVFIPGFVLAFASSAYTGAIPGLMMDKNFFGYKSITYIAGLSTFVLGFALGPLLWAPLSEVYGRRIIAIITLGGFTAFSGGLVASQNIWTIIILRFFSAAMGSSALTNGAATAADIYNDEERGLALGIIALSLLLAPALGPVASGYLGQASGFRWVLGLIAIMAAISFVGPAIWLPETYPPVLLAQRAKRLSRATGKAYVSAFEKEQGSKNVRAFLFMSLTRPFILLFREPIVFLLSLYVAIVYGTLYLLFAAFPIIYEYHYGFTEGQTGLTFIAPLIGFLLGLAYCMYENKRYVLVSRAYNGFPPPEVRLIPTKVGAIVLPISLFWFAWTAAPVNIHWAVSLAASIPFGFSLVSIFLSIVTYLVDSYVIYAASCLAANTVLRSLFGAAFPLFATNMYDNLGINWASTVIAFLGLACAPLPFLFARWGPAIRKRCPYAKQAAAMQEIAKARALEREKRLTARATLRASSAAALGRQMAPAPPVPPIPRLDSGSHVVSETSTHVFTPEMPLGKEAVELTDLTRTVTPDSFAKDEILNNKVDMKESENATLRGDGTHADATKSVEFSAIPAALKEVLAAIVTVQEPPRAPAAVVTQPEEVVSAEVATAILENDQTGSTITALPDIAVKPAEDQADASLEPTNDGTAA